MNNLNVAGKFTEMFNAINVSQEHFQSSLTSMHERQEWHDPESEKQDHGSLERI